MLASMLAGCGHSVGLYTSPHMIDLRERITINGHMISYSDCADLFREIAEAEKQLDEALTFFEILTAAGLKYFANQTVDIAVLETGLGGRLDSTTAANPLVTGITHISLDHTNVLGDNLPAIAREKAGIFKEGVAAISVKQEPEVVEVLREHAEKVGAPLRFTGEEIDFSYRFEANRELGPHTRVCVTTDTSRFEHLAVPLRGEHQAHNCGLALAMLDDLKAHGFELPEDKRHCGAGGDRTGRPHGAGAGRAARADRRCTQCHVHSGADPGAGRAHQLRLAGDDLRLRPGQGHQRHAQADVPGRGQGDLHPREGQPPRHGARAN